MNFQKYIETASIFINDVAEELGIPDDKELAGRVLKAVLHALRSRLTIQESFHFMAQLPLLLKGVYVEGWHYSEEPKRMKSLGDFVREVIHEDAPLGHHDITTAKDGENAVMAVIKVIKKHISEGEVADIKASMPSELSLLWE